MTLPRSPRPYVYMAYCKAEEVYYSLVDVGTYNTATTPRRINKILVWTRHSLLPMPSET